MTQPVPPVRRAGDVIASAVRVALLVAAGLTPVFLLYVATGHQPGQLWEDLLNLFSLGHHCPAGQHWVDSLDRCFPNR